MYYLKRYEGNKRLIVDVDDKQKSTSTDACTVFECMHF